MASRNMAKCRDHYCDGQSVSQRNRQQADPAGAVAAELEVHADRPGTKENQREGAQKFGGQFLREVVHPVASRQCLACNI